MNQRNKNAGRTVKGRILIIDDDQSCCAVLKRTLTNERFSVITAVDGMEGVQKNKENDPDIIILDLEMPNMSGMEALREIRKTDKTVRVIILTGHGDAESIRESENQEVFEYISKPFSHSMLIDVVKQTLAEA